MRKFAAALAILIALFAAALFLVPWNNVLEGRIVAILESKGFDNVSVTVDRVTFSQAQLSNVTLGGATPLTLQSLTLNYTPRELLDGTLDTVSLTGLDIRLHQNDEGWRVSGLPARDGDADKPFSLSGFVDALPFSRLDITNSTLSLDGRTIDGVIPFALSLQKADTTDIDLATQPTTLRAGESDILLGTVTARIVPAEDGDWTGTWAASSLDLNDVTPMPALSGGGTIEIEQANFVMAGTLDSADKSYRGAFNLTIDQQNMDRSKATITAASFPFKEGRVSTRNVTIPFSGDAPIRISMDIQQVSVDAMLQTLTGARVTATGTFSGQVPLIIQRDGTYTLGKGALKADGTGTIQMSPEAIPGDNPQVALVRDILENLQYSLLSASVEEAQGRQITVRLSIEGRNPEIMDGRPVKLNINLTGDVLDFIQQNIMLITNPEKLLEQSIQ